MRRLLTICLFALAAVLVAAPTALAASGPAPTITRVKPMRVSVGNVLTITGAHFKAQRNRNTVIFRGPDGRTAFAKPRRVKLLVGDLKALLDGSALTLQRLEAIVAADPGGRLFERGDLALEANQFGVGVGVEA